MVAKPIIDIMVAVKSLPQATEHIPVLESFGYEYRAHDTVPERMFFAKESAPKYRTHHLNLTQQDSGFWKNQLSFRDYLRKHTKISTEYGELKKRLAEIYAQTQLLDPDGKTEFVTRVYVFKGFRTQGHFQQWRLFASLIRLYTSNLQVLLPT